MKAKRLTIWLRGCVLSVAFPWCCLWQTAPAATPEVMNYQGRILEGGAPVNGQRNIRFQIFNAPTGGSLLFTETKSGVTVSDGLFATTFGQNQSGGSAASLTEALATAGENAHLEVRVGTTTLAPREKITAAAFALRAASVDTPLGLGEAEPGTTLHLTTVEQNLQPSAFSLDDIIVEDGDAILGLYSTPVGAYGSGVVLKEIQGAGDPFPGTLKSTWAMVRETEGNGNGLQFTYGTDPRYNANPLALRVDSAGFMTIPPQKRYYSIGYTDYTHRRGVYGTGEGWTSDGSGFLEMLAPVHLPDGAKVTELRGYGYDRTTEDGLEFALIRRRLPDFRIAEELMAVAATSVPDAPDQTTATDTMIDFDVIDNSQFIYRIGVGTVSGASPINLLVVAGIRIEYEVTKLP